MRLDREELTSKDMARLLLSLKEGADLVLAHLAKSPQAAVSIVNYCLQDPRMPWEDYRCTETGVSPTGMPVSSFSAIACVKVEGVPFKGSEVSAHSKKAAAHAACLSLLRSVVGQPDPESRNVRSTATNGTAFDRIEPVKDRTTARGYLQEICQKRGWALPAFEVTSSGPDHAPTFKAVASVEVEGKTISGEVRIGKNRKDAEREASISLVATLAGLFDRTHPSAG